MKIYCGITLLCCWLLRKHIIVLFCSLRNNIITLYNHVSTAGDRPPVCEREWTGFYQAGKIHLLDFWFYVHAHFLTMFSCTILRENLNVRSYNILPPRKARCDYSRTISILKIVLPEAYRIIVASRLRSL